MANLDSMYRELRSLNNQADVLEQKIKNLKKRRSDVEAVKNALRSTSASNASDVNNKIRSSSHKLETSIEYSGREGQLDSIFSGKQEQLIDADGNLSSADNELQRELNDINGQRSDAEANRSRVQREAQSLKDRIEAEERRQREEERRRQEEEKRRQEEESRQQMAANIIRGVGKK